MGRPLSHSTAFTSWGPTRLRTPLAESASDLAADAKHDSAPSAPSHQAMKPRSQRPLKSWQVSHEHTSPALPESQLEPWTLNAQDGSLHLLIGTRLLAWVSKETVLRLRVEDVPACELVIRG